MSWFSRKKIILLSLAAIVLMAGGWLYANRATRVSLAAYIPESALGYLEVNDWPQVMERLTRTSAWKELAPAYGIPAALGYAGKAGWLASFGIGGETALLARSQFALVVTGLEVRGEEVKPHIALIAETHTSPYRLREIADTRLAAFAREAFGQEVKESVEHSGVRISSFRAANADRGLHFAQIESELIVANQIDALRACIDARLGRAASMENNFYLQNSRAIVERDGSAFGFITGQGVTRLMRFGAYLVSGGAIGKAALAGAVGEVFTEFSTRTTDGIAYGASFENGGVVDRYALLFKPDLVDTLKTTLKTVDREPRVFEKIPAEARNVTLITLENPVKALDGIEAAISGRVSAVQGFLLHQFVLSAREAFLGLQKGSKVEEAIGDEIASFDLAAPAAKNAENAEADRIWLIAARDPGLLLAIVEKVMVAGRAELSREKHRGVEILSSSDRARGSTAFLGNFLAVGRREQLVQLIDLLANRHDFKTALAFPSFQEAVKAFPDPTVVKSFDLNFEDPRDMMRTIAQWTAEKEAPEARQPAFDRLPPSISATAVHDRGLYIESHSPFGNFPSLVSIAAGAAHGK